MYLPPVWPEKTDATYPVSIVLGGFVLAMIIVEEKIASLYSK